MNEHIEKCIETYTNFNQLIDFEKNDIIIKKIILPININLDEIIYFKVNLSKNQTESKKDKINLIIIPFCLLISFSHIHCDNNFIHITFDNNFILKNIVKILNFVNENNDFKYYKCYVKIKSKKHFYYSMTYDQLKNKNILESSCNYFIDTYNTFNISNDTNISYRGKCFNIFVKTYSPITNFKIILNDTLFFEINLKKILMQKLLIKKVKLTANKNILTFVHLFYKSLPSEIINQILNFIKFQNMYIYNIPICRNNLENREIYINFSKYDDIFIKTCCENNETDGQLFIKNNYII